MDKIARAGFPSGEAEVATELLAGLLVEQASASPPTTRNAGIMPVKIYAVMALTSMLTFGALVTGYELLFSHQLFA